MCGTFEIPIKLSKVKIKQWHLSSHITGTIIQKSIEKSASVTFQNHVRIYTSKTF